MKKSLLIVLLPFLSFADDVYDFLAYSNSVCNITLGKYSGTTLNEVTYTSSFVNLRMRLLREKVAVRYFPSSQVIGIPNLGFTGSSPSTSSAQYSLRPVSCTYNGITYSFHWRYFDDLTSLYLALQAALKAGYNSPVLDVQAVGSDSSKYINVCFGDFVFDVLTGTNTLYRSIVVNSLATVNSNLSNLLLGIDSLSSSINGVSSNVNDIANSFNNAYYYSSLSFSDLLESAIESDIIDPYRADEIQQRFDSFSSNPSQQSNYASFVRDMLSAARSLSALYSNSNLVSDVGRQLSSSLNDSINSGVSGAAHFHGATTNLLQRITNDTAQIKHDLQAWRTDTTNRLDRQWDGIKKIRDNTGDTAAGVAHIVNDGVKINGPVQVTLGTDNLHVEIANTDLDRLVNGFADASDSAIQKWLREWDLFKDSQLPFMARFSSFIESNTNILTSIDSKLDFGFTNVFDCIYSVLTNFHFAASTNSYLLLSDYADYINTSGLSDLLGVLDDDSYSDLKNELFSLGAADVSSGYGRWWRYYTGLSTIQASSVFKISNLLFDHEKLLKDLKRENSDVVELSDFNVFSELLSKIPSQTHIDNQISALTNSIDQSGFVRIRELIPDLTNRLSLASDLYDHDFALPTDISWVLIPADSSLNIRERVIHISPSEHYRVFQVLHYGIAFSYCIVNLILLPKFLLLLVRLFDRVWNKSESLIYNSTQS